MALDATRVKIGGATVSIGTYAASGGASGDLTDVGHTPEPPELSWERENVDLESERALGIIATQPIKQAGSITVASLEIVNPARIAVFLGQPAANVSGGTVYIGDPTNRYHQITIVVTGLDASVSGYTTETWTLWKAQVSATQPIRFAKGEWSRLTATFRLLRDDTV